MNNTPRNKIASELTRQASQENCDGEPWDTMQSGGMEIYRLERELTAVTEQRDRLAGVIEAAFILIAAKGRHNTMLAHDEIRDAFQSLYNDI